MWECDCLSSMIWGAWIKVPYQMGRLSPSLTNHGTWNSIHCPVILPGLQPPPLVRWITNTMRSRHIWPDLSDPSCPYAFYHPQGKHILTFCYQEALQQLAHLSRLGAHCLYSTRRQEITTCSSWTITFHFLSWLSSEIVLLSPYICHSSPRTFR